MYTTHQISLKGFTMKKLESWIIRNNYALTNALWAVMTIATIVGYIAYFKMEYGA